MVVPGRTYALRLDSLDNSGFNVYGTKTNNYMQGQLYNGDNPVNNSDMLGFVMGVGHNYNN